MPLAGLVPHQKYASDDFEQRARALEFRLGPGDHDRERSFFRAGHAAAYRRVDELDTPLAKRSGDFHRGTRTGRGQIDDQL